MTDEALECLGLTCSFLIEMMVLLLESALSGTALACGPSRFLHGGDSYHDSYQFTITFSFIVMNQDRMAVDEKNQQLEKKNGRPLYSLYRLQYDLAQLADDLPRGVRVVTNDADMSNFCLILEPQEGYLEGCCIHITVWVPASWPCVPLVAKIDTTFNHPNIFGDYICCDILKKANYESVSTYNGGYSPAYSLAGTFMQLASFFSGSNVEQAFGYVANASEYGFESAHASLIRAGQNFDCRKCNWKSELAQKEAQKTKIVNLRAMNDVSMTIVPAATSKKPRKTKKLSLRKINDDVLLVIMGYLDTPSLLVFGKVYPRVSELVQDMNVIARREVRCFVTKRDPRESILGVGVKYNAKYKTFASTFDYISKFAFEDLGIRKDSTNRPIEYWLPLAIDGAHYAKASADVHEQLVILDEVVRQRLTANSKSPAPQVSIAQNPVKQLFAMANALVVDFMSACDAAAISPSLLGLTAKPISSLLKASERAIGGYCSIIHLIASYAIENPQVVRDAHATVQNFNASQAGRHKLVVPDLGQFMVQLSLVDDFSWMDLRDSVVQELFTRSVVWQLTAAPKGAGRPGLAYLEKDAVSEWRLAETFKASRTGLRLCLFQIFFMEKVAKREGSNLLSLRDDFNRRRGLAPPGLTSELLERIQFIYKMDNLGTFSKESGNPTTKEQMTSFLRDRIVESENVGYHSSTAHWPTSRLLAYRARDDSEFRRRMVARGDYVMASASDQPTFFTNQRRTGSSSNGTRGMPSDRGGRGRGGGGGGHGNRRGQGRRG